MYPVGVLFGFGRQCQSDKVTVITENDSRVRHCIVDCHPRNICHCETWTRWQRYSTRPYYRSSRERFSKCGFSAPTYFRVQLLFTAGMTLIDSLDSVLMLYSYTGFPERKFALFAKQEGLGSPGILGETPLVEHEPDPDEDRPEKINTRVKMNAMSGLSIILTLMSILVAFRYAVSRTISGLSLLRLQYLLDYDRGPHRERMRAL